MVYFTADQHFGHTNIIKYCNRPFKTLDAMHASIIQNYQNIVKEEDIVYMIGDLAMWGKDNLRWYEKLLKKLPGQKHLILGNHDKLNPFAYVEAGFTSVHTSLRIQDMGVDVILNHDPAAACIVKDVTWLCGHIHNLFKKVGNVINVGVDVWDFKPVSLTQLKELIV